MTCSFDDLEPQGFASRAGAAGPAGQAGLAHRDSCGRHRPRGGGRLRGHSPPPSGGRPLDDPLRAGLAQDHRPAHGAATAAGPRAAHVTAGRGPTRSLIYRSTPLQGRSIAFVETGAGNVRRVIATVRHEHGRIRFQPEYGPGGRRKILAQITQRGFNVGRPVTVATYTAPGPVKLTRPENVKVRRHGTRITISWDRVSGVARYVVRAILHDGRSLVFLRDAGAHTVTVRAVPGFDAGKVMVAALDAVNQPGPIGTVKLKALKATCLKPRAVRGKLVCAKPKHKKPRHKKPRHGKPHGRRVEAAGSARARPSPARGRVARRGGRSARCGGSAGGEKRVGLAGHRLDHGARTPARTQPPSRHRAVDAHDRAVAAQPDQVELEAHAEGVNGGRPRDVERVVGGQAVQSRQSSAPGAMRCRFDQDEAAGEPRSRQAGERRSSAGMVSRACSGRRGSAARPRTRRRCRRRRDRGRTEARSCAWHGLRVGWRGPPR